MFQPNLAGPFHKTLAHRARRVSENRNRAAAKLRLICVSCGKVLEEGALRRRASHGICDSCALLLLNEVTQIQIERCVDLEAFDEDIELAAAMHVPVLISGASHLDRMRVFRKIHVQSGARHGRLLYCSSGELLSNEVIPLLALAGSVPESTVFLDDVHELESPGQAALSEFLERRIADRTDPGTLLLPQADLRVIVGTGEELFGLVHRGLFEAQLFYRLNTLHINLQRQDSA